jgi:hypothetical protein
MTADRETPALDGRQHETSGKPEPWKPHCSDGEGSAAEPGSQECPAGRIGIAGLVKTVAVSAAVSAATIAAYDHWFAQKIVALDVKGYIARQRDLFVSGKINEEQLKQNFDRLELAREKVPANRVIIMGDVLVRKNVEVIEP